MKVTFTPTTALPLVFGNASDALGDSRSNQNKDTLQSACCSTALQSVTWSANLMSGDERWMLYLILLAVDVPISSSSLSAQFSNTCQPHYAEPFLDLLVKQRHPDGSLYCNLIKCQHTAVIVVLYLLTLSS